MNGQELDLIFGSGFSPVKNISYRPGDLGAPDMNKTKAGEIVQEQQTAISAEFDSQHGTLTLTRNSLGDGLWIPWLGQGFPGNNGQGCGTYTQPVTNNTWVATGPFSGCYAAAFQAPNGVRFAHIITKSDGYGASSVDGQINAIIAKTNATNAVRINMSGEGLGIGLGLIFFMFINGTWKKRLVFVTPGVGKVTRINANSSNVF